MSDAQLVKFGKAAAYMCSPAANLRHVPRKEFVIQLDEARSMNLGPQIHSNFRRRPF